MARQFRSDDTAPWRYGLGSGKDGDLNVSSGVAYSGAIAGGSGASGQKNFVTDTASSFQDGDLVLIHQTRGAGAGNWELNKIASGGGSTTLVMTDDLENTYTDSGASQAQIIEMKEYRNVTISTGGTLSPSQVWDGNKGGILPFFYNGTLSMTAGSINLNGYGFVGGAGVSNAGHNHGRQGEGSSGAGGTQTSSANGNGGGGGREYTGAGGQGAGGGGGGYGAAGGTGNPSSTGTTPAGGIAVGVAEMITAFLGGGGGSGGTRDSVVASSGNAGNGGGLSFIFGNHLVYSGGSHTLRGTGGTVPGGSSPGGAGASGGGLFKNVTADFGSGIANADTNSATGGGGFAGANGALGRFHIDYSGSVTGTTTPTINTRLDPTIHDVAAGAELMMFL